MCVIYKSLTKYCTHIIIVNAVNTAISRSGNELPPALPAIGINSVYTDSNECRVLSTGIN
jgi:hypothetical protein